MLRQDRIVLASTISLLIAVLAFGAASVVAQTPTEIDVLINMRQQLQDMIVLQWGNLATNLILVMVVAALLGSQR